MIIKPRRRDQILYEWEHEDLLRRPGTSRFTLDDARGMVNEIWAAEEWHDKYWRCPDVAILDRKPDEASCVGCSLLLFGRKRCDPVTVLHEVTHARRFGTQTNQHTRGFVEQYIQLLHRYMGWSLTELEFQAIARGLI